MDSHIYTVKKNRTCGGSIMVVFPNSFKGMLAKQYNMTVNSSIMITVLTDCNVSLCMILFL